MSTTALTIGPVHELTQNTVYAVPPVSVAIGIVPGTAAVQGNVVTGTTTGWVTMTGSTTDGIINKFPFPFIRCTDAAGCSVRLTRD